MSTHTLLPNRRTFHSAFWALLFLLCLSPAVAQEQEERVLKTPAALSQAESAWMERTLDLSEEQLAQIRDLTLEYAQQFFAVQQVISDRTEQKLREAEIQSAKAAELQKVLSPQQWQTYQDEHSKWRCLRADMLALNDGK